MMNCKSALVSTLIILYHALVEIQQSEEVTGLEMLMEGQLWQNVQSITATLHVVKLPMVTIIFHHKELTNVVSIGLAQHVVVVRKATPYHLILQSVCIYRSAQ